MPIIFDSTSGSGDFITSPVTWSHVTGTNANRLLVVAINVLGASAAGTCTAVTYNGVSMTKVKTTTNSNVGNNWFMESTVWFLANPSTGSNTVSATITAPSAPDYAGSAVSYYNANQSTTPDATASNTGTTSGALTPSITTVNPGAWIFSNIGTNEDGASASSRVSNKTDRQTSGMASNLNGGMTTTDTNGVVSPGSNTINYTYTGGSGATTFLWANTMVSIAPRLSVITLAPTLITTTTATANGNMDATAAANSDEQGFVYDTVSRADPGNVAPGSSSYASSATTSGTFSEGTFNKASTGLTATTRYYMRAYVHDSTGYMYGGEVIFNTGGSLAWFKQ